ncbi:1-hydroxy-2-methyl-2-(E)-butenyl 4-diphosphate synthase [Cutibacterium acnes JCM 18920]|nr:1-hydroxy-2-methyl-2-(E)-butenyl 4-diphosphate synthase [Cutibacterium acnes JCM 18920]
MGIKILESLNLRPRGLEIVSCPSCGRCQVDVLTLANDVTDALEGIDAPLRVAVMGCVVNGLGEGREADLGVAAGNGKGKIFKHGEVIRTVPESEIVQFLVQEPTGWRTRWTPPGPLRSRSPEVRTRVRQLDDADLSQTIEFLSRAPVTNVFLLSRIRQSGLDSAR